MHHLPALPEVDPAVAAQVEEGAEDMASSWSRALLPLFECAAGLLLSGTLERADGRGILWLPYREGRKGRTREVELNAPGWAVVGCSRKRALADRAVLPVTFGALEGEASWRDETGIELGPHRLGGSHPDETTRLALFTALRTGFAEALLGKGSWPSATSGPGGASAGIGEAANGCARPSGRKALPHHRAQSDSGGAGRAGGADRYRGHAGRARGTGVVPAAAGAVDPGDGGDGLRGLDAPEVAVVAALTHIRS